MGRSRGSLWIRWLLVSAVVAGPPGLAHASERRQHFNIPAQPAPAALREFARQASRQVMFPYAAVSRVTVPPLIGDFTPAEAADRLAAATGLRVLAVNDRTISFAPMVAAAASHGAEPGAPPAVVRPAPTRAASIARPETATAGFSELDEVVVTATRHSESVNRVALSVGALTQRGLDQKGVRNLADLQEALPSFQITGPGGNAVGYPTIRGIQGSAVGVAATTGFYLDDTPLQKRNPGGGSTAGYSAGTPIPPLFDLDRVEVLRGPQGTLFGGGSEGGTIRLITPSPSLTLASTYVRAEASTTEYGDPSFEIGAAQGGPIVKDKLGFRATVWARNTGGWIDSIDRFTGLEKIRNGNGSRARLMRLAVTWAPNDRARVTGAYFSSSDRYLNVQAQTTLSTRYPIVEPTACYDSTVLTPQRSVAYPAPVATGDAACAALTAQGRADFTRPGATYGPYALGPDDQMAVADFRWPSNTNVTVGSLTLDYEFDHATVRSITSYVHDNTNQRGGSGTYISTNRNANATYGPYTIARGLDVVSTCRDACMAASHIDTYNRRYGLSQEIRFASTGEGRPLSWVAGVFYSNQRIHNEQYATITEEESLKVFGATVEQRFAVPPFVTRYGARDGYTYLNNDFKDVEIAGFAEGNYWVNPRLRLTAGIRASRVSTGLEQVTFGPVATYLVPTRENGGLTSGLIHESPITPRFTAQYQFTERDLVYVTASKGFRAGGANAPLPIGFCGPALAVYGLAPSDIPTTYDSDLVWNYEAGGKFRLFRGRLQLNTSVYRIDWTNVQLSSTIPSGCGVSFLLNSGDARVQGLEIEAQAKPLSNLAVDVALGYSDGRYLTDAVAVPASPSNTAAQPLISVRRGQRFAGSPLTLQIGARYDMLLGPLHAYVRGDWSYSRAATNGAFDTFGVGTYAPDRTARSTSRTNLRIGLDLGAFDVNIFANNLFNDRKGVITGGRTTCAGASQGGTAACASYGSFNPFFTLASAYQPRQVGMQVVYRR
jgi:outer membrane receptor protein involved in Fe transport